MDDETMVAVLAHGMLTSLAVVRAALWLASNTADPKVSADVARHGMEQITLISDTLTDLARGLPAEALAILGHRAAGGAPMVATSPAIACAP